MTRRLFAVLAAVSLFGAASVGVAAQRADGSDAGDTLSQPVPQMSQVRRGGLLANRSPGAVVDLARTNAAELAGVPSDQVSVVDVRAVEWPDLSLGCPNMAPPHLVFAQVTVPGFIVELDVA